MVIPTKNLLNHDYLIGNFIGNSAQSAKTKNSETLDNEAFRSFAGGATRLVFEHCFTRMKHFGVLQVVPPGIVI